MSAACPALVIQAVRQMSLVRRSYKCLSGLMKLLNKILAQVLSGSSGIQRMLAVCVWFGCRTTYLVERLLHFYNRQEPPMKGWLVLTTHCGLQTYVRRLLHADVSRAPTERTNERDQDIATVFPAPRRQ